MTSVPDDKLLERIVLDPRILDGKPVVRGTRLTVQFIVGLLAHGASAADIRDEYAGLTDEDVRACLLFASRALDDTSFVPLVPDAA